jgi:hypothetical protein
MCFKNLFSLKLSMAGIPTCVGTHELVYIKMHSILLDAMTDNKT